MIEAKTQSPKTIWYFVITTNSSMFYVLLIVSSTKWRCYNASLDFLVSFWVCVETIFEYLFSLANLSLLSRLRYPGQQTESGTDIGTSRL